MYRRDFVRRVGAVTAVGGSVSAVGGSVVDGVGSTRGHATGQSGGSSEATPIGPDPLGTVAVPDAREAVVGDAGETVYVATRDGFATVDVSDPADPAVLSREEGILADHPDGPIQQIWDLKIDGDTLLVVGPAHGNVAGARGAVAYDVSDPATPVQETVHETTFPIHNCYLVDGVGYLTGNGAAGNPLVTIDVETGEELGRWSLFDVDDAWREVPSQLRALHDVWVHGEHAYLAHWDAGTWILDVSDPAAPAVVSRVRGQPAEHLASVQDPGREGTELPGNDHSAVVDESGTLLGVGLEAWAADAEGAKGDDHDSGHTHADGSITEDGSGGGDTTADGAVTPTGSVGHRSVEGTAGEPGGILFYDVSDPADPQFRSRIRPPPTPDASRDGVVTTAHNFDLVEDRCYSSWYQGGVRVHDVSSPADPVERLHWRDETRASFWTAQLAVPGEFFVAASKDTPGENGDENGPGAIYTFPDVDRGSGLLPDVSFGTGAGAVGVGVGAVLGAGAVGVRAWRQRRRRGSD